jgi:hypothetical protein
MYKSEVIATAKKESSHIYFYRSILFSILKNNNYNSNINNNVTENVLEHLKHLTSTF